MLTSAGNALLEDYERKLNSISGKLEWRRIPGRHRIKRYRCIEEYVDEHGNVIEEGKEHLTTSIPPRFISNDREPVKVAPRKMTKDSGLKKISNTVKVKLMRRKPKARGVITENRRQPNGDEYSADTKVDYVTSTANSSTSKSMKTRATEFSGQNNEDDVILRKYFPADLGKVEH
ncbi:unnamed protein product [Nippostrongylus brasiliensis]|uniref:MBD domain-containing protein n=1 Tax=Nippostrongylus brasiliensis TaxID=27835 RepID=A0A0N4YCX2_NIPBR|nr:unnamed protein product [Nippostrongylus brasiliensis]